MRLDICDACSDMVCYPVILEVLLQRGQFHIEAIDMDLEPFKRGASGDVIIGPMDSTGEPIEVLCAGAGHGFISGFGFGFGRRARNLCRDRVRSALRSSGSYTGSRSKCSL